MKTAIIAAAVGALCALTACRTHDPTQAAPQGRQAPGAAEAGVGGSGGESGELEHVDQGLSGNKLLDPQTDGAPSLTRPDVADEGR